MDTPFLKRYLNLDELERRTKRQCSAAAVMPAIPSRSARPAILFITALHGTATVKERRDIVGRFVPLTLA